MMIRRGQIYNLFSKFHVRHEVFTFYGPRKPDEGAYTDLIYNFWWPYLDFWEKLSYSKLYPRRKDCKNLFVLTVGW